MRAALELALQSQSDTAQGGQYITGDGFVVPGPISFHIAQWFAVGGSREAAERREAERRWASDRRANEASMAGENYTL